MDKLNELSKIIISELDFLKNYNYFYEKKELTKSDFFGDRLLFHYQSSIGDRKIRIYYSDNPIANFSVFIDSSKNDGFLLSDHLSEKGYQTILNHLSNRNPIVDQESFSRKFCLALKYICENYIQEILLCKEWPGKPFDWTPYK